MVGIMIIAHGGLAESLIASATHMLGSQPERLLGLSVTGSAQTEAALEQAYQQLQAKHPGLKVAVRSSATAEDLPDASFAGQQETFLNIEGLANIKHAVHEVFASLFNDRAISYRVHRGYAHENVALSAGVQKMVRSETGASGVMFTLDTESGYRDAVFVTASWGLGETVVQGAVNPDEFYVHKPTLAAGRPAVLRRTLGSKLIKMVYGKDASAGRSVETVDVPYKDRGRFCIDDEQIMDLARQAVTIEQHYQRPMDIEWALDGDDGKLYIVQARPETVVSQQEGGKLGLQGTHLLHEQLNLSLDFRSSDGVSRKGCY